MASWSTRDRGGRWRVLGVAAGLLLLWGGAAGALTATPTPTATQAPTPWATGDLGVKTVAGRVVDARDTEGGIDGARVSYTSVHGSGMVRSDAAGAFGFDLFLHDTHLVTIRAEAEGYLPAEETFTGLGLWFRHEPIVLALTPGYRIVGAVARTPYCGAEWEVVVALRGAGTTRVTTAAATGAFEFAHVPEGDYLVEAVTGCPFTEYPSQAVRVFRGDVSVGVEADPCARVLRLDPAAGPPGSQVEVRGRCYYVHSGGSAAIGIDEDPPQIEVHAGTSGDYAGTIVIPTTARPGDHRVHVVARSGELIGEGIFRVGTDVACLGDCDGDGTVRIAELLRLVRVVLDEADALTCAAALAPGREAVDVAALVGAVERALHGCP